jgi:Putative zinc-finger
MVYDARHALEHPEVAGWALGSLDPDDMAAFERHLQRCDQCRGEVAEFSPVAKSLVLAAPVVEPPADLELKVVAAVQYAAMADSAATSAVPEAPATTSRADAKPAPVTRARRWWHLHWTNPLLSALAAAAVTAAVFLGATLFQSAPALAATFTLRPQPGQIGSATAVARVVTGGFQVKMDLKHLAKLGPGQFYECVYVGQGGRELVSAGTFLTSNGPVTMQSAANPSEFRIIQIRREQPGVDVQHAPVVLTGIADTHS